MRRALNTPAVLISILISVALCACSSDDGGAPSNTMGGAGGMDGATGGIGGLGSGGTGAGAVGGSAGTGVIAGTSGGTAGAAGVAGASSGGSGSSSPAVDAGSPMPDSGSMDEIRPPATRIDLPITVEPSGIEPWFNIYRPTDLDAIDGPLPVIVWASGGCFRADIAWASMLNRWAAAGFIVLGLSESPTEGALGQTTAEHQGQLIDWVVAQNETAGGMYEGKLDTERVVAAGNSCGGVTALNLTAMDARVAAVFVLSGSSAIGAADAAVMGAINVPVGFIVGSPTEDIANPPANMDYELLPDGVPGMVVHRTTGDHFVVSTDAAVLVENAEIALNWMDLALYGTPEAADALTSPNVCAICSAGMWVLKSKHLDKLRR